MPQALTAFLLLSTFPSISMAATPPAPEFLSANHEYSVDLSKTPEDKLLVTVFHATNEVKTLHWSRTVSWERRHPWPMPTARNLDEVKALVANDGNTVVFRDYNAPDDLNDIRVVRREHPKDQLFSPYQSQAFNAAKPGVHSIGAVRADAVYSYVDCVLDFIFDEQNSYALWFGQTDRWLLISLHDFKETVVQDPDTLNSLNRIAHAKAKQLVLQHQPPPLHKILGALKDRVVQFAPSLGSPSSRPDLRGEIAAAYLFLTARQYASDKAFIERLVSFPPEGIQHSVPLINSILKVDCWVSHQERLVGDFLMSRWNGDTNREFIAKEMSLLIPHDQLRHLGTIRINVTFPIDVPPTNSGLVWVYLTPSNVAPAAWVKSSELLSFSSPLYFPVHYGNPPPTTTLGRKGQVTVRGLTPGDYRAKIIWDRIGPTGGLWRTNIHTGVPGDYESTHTPPITVKAGELIENIHLAVTNLIGSTQAP